MGLDKANRLFRSKYMDSQNNVFDAVNMWAHDATKLEAQYQGRLSSSESLTSCLTSNLPQDIDRRKIVRDSEQLYISRYIKEALTQIDDKDVRLSVLQTLNKSMSENNLTFIYLDILTDSQRSRVRVLSRLIWYNLYPEKGK